MAWSERNDDDYEGFVDFLREILPELDKKAAGITRFVMDNGLDSLSAKQEYVFETEVMDMYPNEKCKVCGDFIPWSYMYAAQLNDGLCYDCDKKLEKLEKSEKSKKE